MRCSGCGNEIPDWAGGVCYTCGRIHREEKRFGAHPSARKRARMTPATPAARPRSVRRGRVTLPPRLAPATSFEPPGHCPICGQDVPQNELEDHVELHTRLQRSGVSTRARLPQHEAPKSQPSADTVPGQAPLQVRRRAVNRLLEDIYGKKCLVSDILRSGGVDQADITRVYERRLNGFFDELLAVWRVAFAGELAPGAWYVITRNYGFDGVTPAPIEALAEELAVAPQRVSEIRTQALKALRAPASRSYLEAITITVAHRQLKKT